MTGLLACPSSPASTYDVALLDLDGVVYRGPHAVPFAAQAIAAAQDVGMSAMYVTNNANRPPETVANHLTNLAIPTSPTEVTTAAQAAASLIAQDHPQGTRVLVVGGDGLRQAIAAEGLTVVASADDQPDVVVQGFAPSVGWPELSEALLAINAGAEHVASNLDATLPTERGIALGNGSLVAALVNASGRQPRSSGKPQPEIFHQAARRAGATNPVVVGDRLDTDLQGARAAGYPGMHVLTGVDGTAALLACVPAQRPDLLALDLRGLLVPHPAVVPDGAWWRCEDAAARIDTASGTPSVVLASNGSERALTDGDEVDLDELRAACVAAWDASDAAGLASVLGIGAPQVRVRERPQDVGAIA